MNPGEAESGDFGNSNSNDLAQLVQRLMILRPIRLIGGVDRPPKTRPIGGGRRGSSPSGAWSRESSMCRNMF